MAFKNKPNSPYSVFLSAVLLAGGTLSPSTNTTVSSISTPAPVVEGNGLTFVVTLSSITTTPDAFVVGVSPSGANPASTLRYNVAPTFSNGVQYINGYAVVPVGVTTFNITIPTLLSGYFTTDETLTMTLGGVSAVGTIQSVPYTEVLWSAPEFGAVGNGIADDSTAVELMLASSKNVNMTGGTFRVTRPLAPINLANINGLSGKKYASPSGTVWGTESKSKSFTAYDGTTKTITSTCASVVTLGTWNAEIIMDNSNYQFDKATLNINIASSAGGSLTAVYIKYYIVPIVDGIDFQCMYQSYNLLATSGYKNTLTWNAFVPVSGTVTGYKIYGRNGFIGTTASLTFVDDGTVTPTGSNPDTNASGIFMGGKYYGFEMSGIKFTVRWAADTTISHNSRFGVGFYPDFAYWFRMGIGPWDADTNGFILSDCKFDFGDALVGGTMGFITTNNRHAGISRALRNIIYRKNIFNTNNAISFLDRSVVADVGYTEKTITNVLVEDNIFQGQGQLGHTKPFNTPEFRMAISEDGMSRTQGLTIRRNRFDDYVYAAIEVVTNLGEGYPDLDVNMDINNNIITNTGWSALGVGCGITFNNSYATYSDFNPRFYNFTITNNYMGNSALGDQFKYLRNGIIDSNIFERTTATNMTGVMLWSQNWDNVTFTNNYGLDPYNVTNDPTGTFRFNLFSNNTIRFNRFDITGLIGSYGFRANNTITDNVHNMDYAPAVTYTSIMIQGTWYPTAKNNTIRNKIYFKTGVNPVGMATTYDAGADQTSPKEIDDSPTVYIGGSLQSGFPKTTVAWTGALVDLSGKNWHLSHTITLTGAASAVWECRLPGVVGNRTITNSSGQSCTISCFNNATKFTILNGQTKTVNVSSVYAVTEVV